MFNKHFRPSSDILSAMIPILDELAGPVADKFTLNKQEAFEVDFVTEQGFHYGIDPARVFVEFQHRLKFKNISGSAPVMELISKAEPYTRMLDEVTKRALEAANRLVTTSRTLEKIGVISTTVVSETDAPPGIQKCIEYFAKPWPNGMEHYHIQTVAFVDRAEEWNDRCIHTLLKTEAEAEEGLVHLVFDFQRIYKNGKGYKDVASLRPIVQSVRDAALQYFERLAEGDIFDANDTAE